MKGFSRLKGVIPALVTPYTKADEVDADGIRWLVRNAIDNGVHGLMVVGSLGEFTNLSRSERTLVISTAVDEANGKVPIIAGIGSASTQESVSFAKDAAKSGADYLLALAPYYYNIGEAAVYAHYETLAHSVDLPIVLYNFPGTTKINLSPALVARLSEIDNIVGIKNSVDSLVHLRQIIRATRNSKHFSVIAGMEDYMLVGLLLGATGTVSGLGNFVPGTLVEIYNHFVRGEVLKAAETFNRVIVPLKELAPPPEPISALKIGASLIGPIGTAVRPPLQNAPEDTRKLMKVFLSKEGLLHPSYVATTRA
jgi:4-hydroxy-tetrahydrodipicolinate synthase